MERLREVTAKGNGEEKGYQMELEEGVRREFKSTDIFIVMGREKENEENMIGRGDLGSFFRPIFALLQSKNSLKPLSVVSDFKLHNLPLAELLLVFSTCKYLYHRYPEFQGIHENV